MKLFVIIIQFILLAALGPEVKAEEKPTIVVYDLIVRGKAITSEQGAILSNRIRSIISKTGKYFLVSPKEIQKYIGEYLRKKEFNEDAMCDEDSCMVEVAGALGAEHIMSGTIAKIGKTYTIDLYMKHMLTQRITKSSNKDCKKCEIDDLLDIVAFASNEIVNSNVGTTEVPVNTDKSSFVDEKLTKSSNAAKTFKSTETAVNTKANNKDDVNISISNDIAIDSNTGLYWQKNRADFEMEWQPAKNYCSDLKIGEYSDWRLPSRKEYINMLGGCPQKVLNGEYGACNSCSNSLKCSKMFSKNDQWFWTLSEYEVDKTKAWIININGGHVNENAKTIAYYVRCIRNEPESSVNSNKKESVKVNSTKTVIKQKLNIIAGKDTVTDQNAGLSWQKIGAGKEMEWMSAKNYCLDLSLEGYTDWRLPSRKEYINMLGGCPQKVLNGEYGACNSCSNSLKCSKILPANDAWFWTSTDYAVDKSNAWIIYISGGHVNENAKTVLYNVRCVRNVNSQ